MRSAGSTLDEGESVRGGAPAGKMTQITHVILESLGESWHLFLDAAIYILFGIVIGGPLQGVSLPPPTWPVTLARGGSPRC